jgi:GT2 family glycosyltransferase
VFFGRLEERKGLVLFCDALDRLLAAGGPRPGRVTFLGKPGRVGPRRAELFIAERAVRWDVPHALVGDRDRAGAQAYLREPGRLAVIPSLEDNSPYTVLECLTARVPFVAAAVGGVPELVAEADRERVCFAPRASSLAATLAAALGQGMRPGACAFDLEDNNRGWVALHEGELAATASAGREGVRSAVPAPSPGPLVSVCLTHHDRPTLLEQALASLRAQDYPSLEVILVDDGSPGEEAHRYLASLEPEFTLRGWSIVRQENRYPGAARNNAARHARGDYLLFMDDDNVARPDEVRRLVEVAVATGADILTCVSQPFRGEAPPDTGREGDTMWVPSGADLSLGMYENCFGDVNALVRRGAFEDLGGFSEDYRVGHEDWEFFARAVLRGYSLHPVPLPLFWYRVNDAGIQRSSNVRANYARSLRPYLEAVPPGLRDALRLGQGLFLVLHPPQPLGDLPPSPVAELKAIKKSLAWRLAKPVLALEGRIRGNPRRPRRP